MGLGHRFSIVVINPLSIFLTKFPIYFFYYLVSRKSQKNTPTFCKKVKSSGQNRWAAIFEKSKKSLFQYSRFLHGFRWDAGGTMETTIWGPPWDHPDIKVVL